MIKGFAALAPQYAPMVYFSKRYPTVTIRVSYLTNPPESVIHAIGGKLDRMHDYYLGSCVGVAHMVASVVEHSDPYNDHATVEAIRNILAEQKADLHTFAKATQLPDQLTLVPRSQEELDGLDEHLYHAEVERATSTEAQANGGQT